ncbi:hypothetical protein [Falsibacillus pallidus]|uniref:hypothetical protein n=1 Tax=Falsibacillus pallidus TaxID=493781 RepID=UPI003D970548
MNSKTLLKNLLPLIFPLAGVIALFTNFAGSATIPFFIVCIVLGLAFSVYLLIKKRLMQGAVANIIIRALLLVMGLIFYLFLVASGV